MAWRSIVFIQDPEPDSAPAQWLDNAWQGDDDSLVDYLAEYDQDGAGEVTESEPWGSSDETFEHGPYVVAYNRGLGYVSLNEKVDKP